MENIKSKQLRIGNLVKEGEVRIICDDLIFIKESSFSLENFEPIPLTEEWLLKFGFAPKNNSSPQTFHKIGQYNFKVGKWKSNTSGISLICCNSLGRHIDYVHQLQNLYFALTNEELTIK